MLLASCGPVLLALFAPLCNKTGMIFGACWSTINGLLLKDTGVYMACMHMANFLTDPWRGAALHMFANTSAVSLDAQTCISMHTEQVML